MGRPGTVTHRIVIFTLPEASRYLSFLVQPSCQHAKRLISVTFVSFFVSEIVPCIGHSRTLSDSYLPFGVSSFPATVAFVFAFLGARDPDERASNARCCAVRA